MRKIIAYARGVTLLSDQEIGTALRDLPGWQRHRSELRRSVTFATFREGIDAVSRIAGLADAADHHPDIDIRWRTVTFILATHDEGGITERDTAMARAINEVAGI